MQLTQLLFEVIAVLLHRGGSKAVWKLSFHDLFAYPDDHTPGSVREPRDAESLERYGRNPRLGRYTQNDVPLSPTSSAGSRSLYLDAKDYKDAKDLKDVKTPASLLKHEYYDYPYQSKKLTKNESVRCDKKIEAERELYSQYREQKVPSYSSH